MKILVLDAHANAAVAVVQSLGRAGHQVYLAGAEADPVSWRSRYPRARWLYPDPFHDVTAFQEWLLATQKAEGFAFILALTDGTLYPCRELRQRGAAPAALVLPDEESFDWVFVKARTVALARECGVAVPESIEIESPAWDPRAFGEFPYFVKPVRSKVWDHGVGLALAPRLARTPAQLERIVGELLRYGPVTVQRYEVGRGTGLAVLCRAGEILEHFAYARVHEYPLTGGASSYRVSIEPSADLLDAGQRLLGRIRWTGVAMVEFKERDGRHVLMEINGRFWGSLALAIAAGVDFPRDLIDLLSGTRVPRQPRYRVGLYVRRVDTDYVWQKENLRANKRDPYLLTHSAPRAALELLRVVSGKERWDHASWRDPLPILTVLRRTARDELLQRWTQVQQGLALARARRQAAARLRHGARRVLVLCHGNICRSPFVGQLLERGLRPHGIEVRSAGFHPIAGRRTPADFLGVAQQARVALDEHRSHVVDRDLIAWSDLIVIMDRENWKLLRQTDREALERTIWLGAVLPDGPVELPDPYGQSETEMHRIAARLMQASEALVAELAPGAGGDLARRRVG